MAARTRLLCTVLMVLTIALPAGLGYAAAQKGERPRGRATVDQVLAQMYPKASHDLKRSYQVNGVEVFEFDVRDATGDTYAVVTEYGDFLVSGVPISPDAAPQPVKTTINGLFKGASQADAFLATTYFIWLGGPDNKNYQLQFDPAGRLVNVRSEAELSRTKREQKGQEKAPNTEHARLAEAAKSRFGDVQILEITRWTESPEFFHVAVKRGDDKGWVVVSPQNQVVQQHMNVDPARLPEAVRRTVQEMFGGTIKDAAKRESWYWQFDKNIAGERTLVQVEPTGDIRKVFSPDADATTAGSRERK